MFLASDVETQVKVLLDDTQSSRYTFADDIRPAINLAVPYALLVIASAFEASQIQTSALAEIINVYVGEVSVANNEASLDLSEITEGIFRIIGVEANPHYTHPGGVPTVYLYAGGTGIMASRLTIEEWGDNISNPFKPGNAIDQAPTLKKGAYMYRSGYLDSNYILFRPATMLEDTEPVLAAWYIKNPIAVTTTASEINLPLACLPFLVDKVTNYISMQQGNRQSLFIVTERDMATLAMLFTR
jgi:hypothetical protein